MTRPESTSPQPRVAVIGAGTMGGAMATRLLAAHFEVDLWSRSQSSTSPLVELGGLSYADVRDAVAKADVVLSVLPTADVTEEVMLNAEDWRRCARALSGSRWEPLARSPRRTSPSACWISVLTSSSLTHRCLVVESRPSRVTTDPGIG